MLPDFISRCADRGIHVMAYLSFTNMFVSDMHRNLPESRGWSQLDEEGRPVPYGGARYKASAITRYLACLNEPGWRTLLKQRLAAALDAGYDSIFYDNVMLKCTCSRCESAFSEYTEKLLGRRLGIPRGVTSVEPVPDDYESNKAALSRQPDGVPTGMDLAEIFRDWRFRVEGELLGELITFAREKCPDVVICANSKEMPHIDDALNARFSEDVLLPRWEEGFAVNNAGLYLFLHSEREGIEPTLVEHGKLIPHQYEGGKLRAVRRYERLAGLMSVPRARRAVAEALAWGDGSAFILEGGFARGIVFGEEQSLNTCRAIGDYYRFIEAHLPCFTERRSAANLAVVEGEFHASRRMLNLLAETSMVFDILKPEETDLDDLQRYETAILDSPLVPDSRLSAYGEYTKSGGCLLWTYGSSLKKSRIEWRPDYGLQELFGASFSDQNRGETLVRSVGDGKVVYAHPWTTRWDTVDEYRSRKITVFLNSHQSRRPIEITAGRGILGSVAASVDGGRHYVYLINYLDEPREKVRLRLRTGREIKQVELMSPDDEGGKAVVEKSEEGVHEILVLKIDVFALLIAE